MTLHIRIITINYKRATPLLQFRGWMLWHVLILNLNSSDWITYLNYLMCMICINVNTMSLLPAPHTRETWHKHKGNHQVLGHHTLTLSLHMNLYGVWTICSFIHISSTHKQLQLDKFSVPLSTSHHVQGLWGLHTL